MNRQSLLNPEETLELLKLIAEGKKSATWLQQNASERKVLNIALNQLSRHESIEREYDLKDGIEYIIYKVSPNGRKFLDRKLPIRKLGRIRI